VRPNVAGIDGRGMDKNALIDQRLKDVGPNASAGPPVEAVVDRRRRAVFDRAVLPSASRLDDMENAADDTTVIDTPCARLVLRQVRLDRRPGFIIKPEKIAHHRLQIAVCRQ